MKRDILDMHKIINFDDDDYYLIFVLGYDLLQDDFMLCKEKACDLVFDICKTLIAKFKRSEESMMFELSTYDALRLFLENHNDEIVGLLTDELSYKKGKQNGNNK